MTVEEALKRNWLVGSPKAWAEIHRQDNLEHGDAVWLSEAELVAVNPFDEWEWEEIAAGGAAQADGSGGEPCSR